VHPYRGQLHVLELRRAHWQLSDGSGADVRGRLLGWREGSDHADQKHHDLIAGRTDIQDADGHPSESERRERGEQMAEEDTKPVIIHDYAWLGRDVHVLKGVTIGRGAVVVSGSVVASDVPDNALAMGVPARVVKVSAPPRDPSTPPPPFNS
jgi:hypothetical protein